MSVVMTYSVSDDKFLLLPEPLLELLNLGEEINDFLS